MDNSLDVPEPGHSHVFGLDRKHTGERKAHVVIAITAAMMLLEISAGIAFGSMALLADGIHMASHTVALGIVAFAYAYARNHANDPRFSFGVGKVNALGGYTGAILLGIFAFMMASESIARLFQPVEIAFNQAIVVAVLGLAVNGVSVLILGDNGHSHDRHRADGEHHHHGHHRADGHHHDHNRRAAYFHVLADALTSVTAIFALVVGKTFNVLWVDPLMGVAGSVLVAKWSHGLLKQTSTVLLDYQNAEGAQWIRDVLDETAHVELFDLHVWSVAPGRLAAIVGVVTTPGVDIDAVRHRLSEFPELAHVTIEARVAPVATL